MESTPKKKTTGINITKNIRMQVRIDAVFGLSFFDKTLNTGLKIPVDTIPKIIMAKKGASSLPARKIEMQNRAIKKINTAL